MNEKDIKEAKLIALSMAKLREFCEKQEDCDVCPLSYGNSAGNPCALNDITPNKWDPDQALYRIGYKEGGVNSERHQDIQQ